MIAALTQNQQACIVAIVLFVAAALIRVVQPKDMKRPCDSIFVAVGLAFFAAAFVLIP